jgi:glycosyltransferase involved in cell wall biosynthesis
MLTRNDTRESVVVPAHNAAGTISETLRSLLAQSWDPWEALIVDDGSTDDTAAVASRMASHDSRIRCVSQKQGGVSAARNKGVEHARSDWLLFLDADDWLLPAYLRRMNAVLTASANVDAAFCGAARVTPDGLHVKEDYHDESGDMFHTFAHHAVFPIHACIGRKSIVQSVGDSIYRFARAKSGISGSGSPARAPDSSASPERCSRCIACVQDPRPWTTSKCSGMAPGNYPGTLAGPARLEP